MNEILPQTIQVVKKNGKTFGYSTIIPKSPKKIAFVYMNDEANVGRGAGYIAGLIRQVGHDMVFYNTMYTSPEQIAEDVVDNETDVLMISTMTLNFPEAVRLIQLVKFRKYIPVLLGGIHAIIEKEKILQNHPEVDFVCVGEGEVMVLEFLEHFQGEQLDQVPNLLYRANGQIVTTAFAPAADLSALPEFPWDLFRDDNIVQPDVGFTYVTASRGCPYSCTYCCNPVYLKTYKKSYLRTRPVDSVIAELKFIRDRYKPSLLYFGDEMLLFDLDYVRELFARFKEEVGGAFGLQGRVEFLDDDTVKFLADCGCRYVGLGAECGDEEFTKKVLRRKISNDVLEVAVKRLQKYNIFVSTFNMIGYPVENDDYLTLQTIRLIERLRPDYTQISIFYPFPGTVLADKAFNEGFVDMERIQTITDYFSESVLKNREYLTELRQTLHKLFNPKPFPNAQEWIERDRRLKSGTPDPAQDLCFDGAYVKALEDKVAFLNGLANEIESRREAAEQTARELLANRAAHKKSSNLPSLGKGIRSWMGLDRS